jgi:CelD/BcsL family acetyltransferase involved in cellulose biosynthesis
VITTVQQSGVAVEQIVSASQLDDLYAEWNELVATVRPDLPFSTPQWMAAWWTNLRRHNRWTRDTLRVLAFRRSGRLIAVAPYMITTRVILGVPVLRVFQPIGTDPNITEIRGMLVAAQDECDVTAALVDYTIESIGCDEIVISGVRDESAAIALVARSDVIEVEPRSMFVLELPATWDELRAALPRNMRESLRKCRNSLARDGHVPTFRALAAEEQIVAMLPRFLELHQSRAEATDTVPHRDVFARACDRDFLRDITRRLASAGRARLFTMEIEGVVVAARLAMVCGDALYLYYSGYDTTWGKYSVMTSVTSEAIQYAITNGFRHVNLSTGADQSKLRWRPREIVTRSFMIRRASIQGHVIRWAIETGRSIRGNVDQRRTSSAQRG